MQLFDSKKSLQSSKNLFIKKPAVFFCLGKTCRNPGILPSFFDIKIDAKLKGFDDFSQLQEALLV
jgi:hypothetical protein